MIFKTDMYKNIFDFYIVKHNSLVEAYFSLTLIQQKIVLVLASLNKPEATEFKEIEFDAKELMKIIGLSNKNYAYLRRETYSLNKCVIEMVLNNGEELRQAPWMSYVNYFKKENKVKVKLKLNDAVKPFILQLNSHFTLYKLSSIIQLSSVYSIRLFEILIQYKNIGYRVISIEKLKKMLQIEDKHKRYADFRRHVILQAQKELEKKGSIYFEFEPIKSGRYVESLKFTIYKNDNHVDSDNIDKCIEDKADCNKCFNQCSDPYQNEEFSSFVLSNISTRNKDDIYGSLESEFGLSHKDVAKLLKNFDKEKLWEKFHYYHYCKSRKEIKNPTAWFISAVTKDYSTADMKAANKVEEVDPQEEKVKELKSKYQELRIKISNAIEDIKSPVAQYSESIREKYEEELKLYKSEISEVKEELNKFQVAV